MNNAKESTSFRLGKWLRAIIRHGLRAEIRTRVWSWTGTRK